MEKKEMPKMRLDEKTFGKIIDEVLKENEILLQIRMPEGTNDPVVESNVGAGTIEFYILMAGMVATIEKMIGEMGGRECLTDYEDLIDAILKMIKDELMETEEE